MELNNSWDFPNAIKILQDYLDADLKDLFAKQDMPVEEMIPRQEIRTEIAKAISVLQKGL